MQLFINLDSPSRFDLVCGRSSVPVIAKMIFFSGIHSLLVEPSQVPQLTQHNNREPDLVESGQNSKRFHINGMGSVVCRGGGVIIF